MHHRDPHDAVRAEPQVIDQPRGVEVAEPDADAKPNRPARGAEICNGSLMSCSFCFRRFQFQQPHRSGSVNARCGFGPRRALVPRTTRRQIATHNRHAAADTQNRVPWSGCQRRDRRYRPADLCTAVPRDCGQIQNLEVKPVKKICPHSAETTQTAKRVLLL